MNLELVAALPLTSSCLIVSPVSFNMEHNDSIRFTVSAIISLFNSLGNFWKKILAIRRAPPESSTEKSQEYEFPSSSKSDAVQIRKGGIFPGYIIEDVLENLIDYFIDILILALQHRESTLIVCIRAAQMVYQP